MIDKDKIIQHLLYVIEQKDREIELYKSEAEHFYEKYEKPNNEVLHGKPHSDISKLKVFMDVFKSLSTENHHDVDGPNFVFELVKTGKFTEDDAHMYIIKAQQNGQIYQRSEGKYQRA